MPLAAKLTVALFLVGHVATAIPATVAWLRIQQDVEGGIVKLRLQPSPAWLLRKHRRRFPQAQALRNTAVG